MVELVLNRNCDRLVLNWNRTISSSRYRHIIIKIIFIRPWLKIYQPSQKFNIFVSVKFVFFYKIY
ncbi:hypothetical protein CS542_10105 [Pedobacter sp. IW39]|nr:hypothetical protein CS542_10105 [Pedobacter sp. IW39]